MVANGRNIVISCFEARTLVFFARASRTSSPNKRFETPILTPKRTKCLQKILKGPQKDLQVTHRRPKNAQIQKQSKKLIFCSHLGPQKPSKKCPQIARIPKKSLPQKSFFSHRIFISFLVDFHPQIVSKMTPLFHRCQQHEFCKKHRFA